MYYLHARTTMSTLHSLANGIMGHISDNIAPIFQTTNRLQLERIGTNIHFSTYKRLLEFHRDSINKLSLKSAKGFILSKKLSQNLSDNIFPISNPKFHLTELVDSLESTKCDMEYFDSIKEVADYYFNVLKSDLNQLKKDKKRTDISSQNLTDVIQNFKHNLSMFDEFLQGYMIVTLDLPDLYKKVLISDRDINPLKVNLDMDYFLKRYKNNKDIFDKCIVRVYPNGHKLSVIFGDVRLKTHNPGDRPSGIMLHANLGALCNIHEYLKNFRKELITLYHQADSVLSPSSLSKELESIPHIKTLYTSAALSHNIVINPAGISYLNKNTKMNSDEISCDLDSNARKTTVTRKRTLSLDIDNKDPDHTPTGSQSKIPKTDLQHISQSSIIESKYASYQSTNKQSINDMRKGELEEGEIVTSDLEEGEIEEMESSELVQQNVPQQTQVNSRDHANETHVFADQLFKTSVTEKVLSK